MELKKALEELRKGKERKFNQSIDLIINLKKFDVKKTQINTFTSLPHQIKEKKICGFIEGKSDLIDTISKTNFSLYKDKKKLKKLVKKYDFFIASGPNMPGVATTFGRVLGPANKMPSPKLGIVMEESDEGIKKLIKKINSALRIQAKQPSIKLVIGKEKMDDDKIMANVKAAYDAVLKELPLGKENLKSLMIKLTMEKPIRFEI